MGWPEEPPCGGAGLRGSALPETEPGWTWEVHKAGSPQGGAVLSSLTLEEVKQGLMPPG